LLLQYQAPEQLGGSLGRSVLDPPACACQQLRKKLNCMIVLQRCKCLLHAAESCIALLKLALSASHRTRHQPKEQVSVQRSSAHVLDFSFHNQESLPIIASAS
jgi:hypothetical protein